MGVTSLPSRALLVGAVLLSQPRAIHGAEFDSGTPSAHSLQFASKSGISSVFFADENPEVSIRLSLNSHEMKYFKEDWVRRLKVAVVDGDGSELNVVIKSITDTTSDADRKRAEDHGGWLRSGIVQLSPLKPGDYKVTISYEGVASVTGGMAVRSGDEDDAVREAYLTRESLRAKSFEDFRTIQMKRLAIRPRAASILLELESRAEIEGSLAETDKYIRDAVELMSKNMAESGIPRAGPEWLSYESQVTLLQQRRRLLPTLFEDQKHRRIIAKRTPEGTTHLAVVEKDTGRVVNPLVP
jgi:hypothetical protein